MVFSRKNHPIHHFLLTLEFLGSAGGAAQSEVGPSGSVVAGEEEAFAIFLFAAIVISLPFCRPNIGC